MIAGVEPTVLLGLLLSLAVVNWMRERSRLRSAERLARNTGPGVSVLVFSRESRHRTTVTTVENRTDTSRTLSNRGRVSDSTGDYIHG